MKAAEAIGQYVALMQANEGLFAGEPALLERLRSQALGAMPAYIENYKPDKTVPAACRVDEMFAPDYGINLRHLPMAGDDTSVRGAVAEGVEVYSLRSLPDDRTDAVAAIMGDTEPLNALLLTDGIYIRVTRGYRIEKPVQIVNLFQSDAPTLSPRRVVVDAEPDSSLRVLLCDHSSSQNTPHLSYEVINVNVGRGARVELYDIEESAPATRRRWHLYATQHDNSELVVNTTYLHGGVTANAYTIDVAGNGCYTNLSGLAICTGTQVVSNQVTLRHHGERCTSRQLFKNAVFDRAHGCFGGRVVVDTDARYTDAVQTNRNILASPQARMDASPQLEIYCDEVKAGHGATTGQLDERALFYMQTRGIPADEARRMLTEAFMADVIDNIGYDMLRQRLHVLVERRLNGGKDACDSCGAGCGSK